MEDPWQFSYTKTEMRQNRKDAFWEGFCGGIITFAVVYVVVKYAVEFLGYINVF